MPLPSSTMGSSQPPDDPDDPLLFGSHECLRDTPSNESVENLLRERESFLSDAFELVLSLRESFLSVDPVESRRPVDPFESLRTSDPDEVPSESFLSDDGKDETCDWSFTPEPRTRESRRLRHAAGTAGIPGMLSRLPRESRRAERMFPIEPRRPCMSQSLESTSTMGLLK